MDMLPRRPDGPQPRARRSNPAIAGDETLTDPGPATHDRTETDLRTWVPTTRSCSSTAARARRGPGHRDVFNPATEAGHRDRRRRPPTDQVDQAVPAARRRSRRGRRSPARSAPGNPPVRRRLRGARRPAARPRSSTRSARPSRFAESCRSRWRVTSTCAGRRRRPGRPHGAPGRLRQAGPELLRRGLRPVGVVAGDHRLQLPAQPRDLQVRRRAGRRAAPSVLLPSPRTPLTTLLLGDLFQEAGLPPGVMNVVIGDGPSVGQHLTTHPRRRPGLLHRLRRASAPRIMEQAARGLKGVTLELGGQVAQHPDAGHRRPRRSPSRCTCGGRATAVRAAPRWPGCWCTRA